MNEEPAVDPPALWDLPLAEAPLVFLDLEMTGLDAENDHVVEVCLERVRGGIVEQRFASLVKPPARAGGNANIHGLDEAALASAPPFDAIADAILAVLDQGIPVAHAAEWDIAFLRAEMARAGRAFEPKHWIDTLTLSRRAFGLESHSLSKLCAHFGIDPGSAHRAADDVRAMRAVFDRCVRVLAPKSARDLWHVRVAERHARPAILEACARAAESGAPVRVRYRPSHRAAHDLVIVIKELLRDANPPRVVVYEVESRARRELRADRILQIDDA